jgi:hypothetical protein
MALPGIDALQRGCAACPLCARRLVAPAECGTCGSLEGFRADSDAPAPSRVFGYDWASGLVAPWHGDGGVYATPEATARAALELAGVRCGGDAVVIDLGCGDAAILRCAAKVFGTRGIGFELDEAVVAEARAAVDRDGVGASVRIALADLAAVDLGAEIAAAGAALAVVTCFLLPGTLEKLRPALQRVAADYGAVVVSFKWPIRGWAGAREARPGFSVYRRA